MNDLTTYDHLLSTDIPELDATDPLCQKGEWKFTLRRIAKPRPNNDRTAAAIEFVFATSEPGAIGDLPLVAVEAAATVWVNLDEDGNVDRRPGANTQFARFRRRIGRMTGTLESMLEEPKVRVLASVDWKTGQDDTQRAVIKKILGTWKADSDVPF